MKRHGPIEALVSELYPCLKGHGPIEAEEILSMLEEEGTYPCLKGHGPIEALFNRWG